MLFIAVILVQSKCWSCTIFCAKDSHGHVWVGNNEDGVFSFGTKINISPKTESSLAYISAGIRSGLREEDLTDEEKKLLLDYVGENWKISFGLEKKNEK